MICEGEQSGQCGNLQAVKQGVVVLRLPKEPNHVRDPRQAYFRMKSMKMDKYHPHELTLLFT